MIGWPYGWRHSAEQKSYKVFLGRTAFFLFISILIFIQLGLIDISVIFVMIALCLTIDNTLLFPTHHAEQKDYDQNDKKNFVVKNWKNSWPNKLFFSCCQKWGKWLNLLDTQDLFIFFSKRSIILLIETQDPLYF